jgi:hypothetical protein
MGHIFHVRLPLQLREGAQCAQLGRSGAVQPVWLAA